MADVVLDRVSKRYGRAVWGMRCVSLSVRDGELMVVVGPSGSGKSTVLRLIAGLERVTAGEVRIGGRVVNDVPPHERGAAMVFQNSTLYPHMTVERNLRFGMGRGARHGSVAEATEPIARVRGAAEVLRIGHLLGRYPGELSGGERQRAALAKAMVRRPRVFLFDEPLSNLDVQLRHEARAEIKALHRRLGTTTIHVTHDQEEAMVLGDRIAVLHEGQVQQVGTPEEVYRQPANAFVGGFMGSPAMNLVPGVLEGGEADVVFRETTGADGGGVRAVIGGAVGGALAERLKRTKMAVQMGVRPQALRVVRDGSGPGTGEVVFELTVAMVQPLGDAEDLVCDGASGRRVVVRARRDAGRAHWSVGDRFRAALDPGELCFFRAGEGERNVLEEGGRPVD